MSQGPTSHGDELPGSALETPGQVRPAAGWPAFSLLFFASQPAVFGGDKFGLFRKTTRFADERGFEAVWLPERHFHAFGGLFPNPALAAVVLAESTRRIRIRAGSVVLPLHHPIRVAEEWAVVDNLSGGRVDLSFAMGWNPNDFVLAPDQYEDRKAVTLDRLDQVRRLWAGQELAYPNGMGQSTPIRVHPLPVQSQLDIWFTCSGGAERFHEVGQWGFHVLTALLFQSMEELAAKIRSYRAARQAAGHPGRGRVTLMLHTHVGHDEAKVKERVREPFKRYLESSADLWQVGEVRLKDMSARRKADMLEYAFERYYQKTGLMGGLDSARETVRRAVAAGVDEIACLIDFGLEADRIMEGLEVLDQLRREGVDAGRNLSSGDTP